jgi:hypothetical protein
MFRAHPRRPSSTGFIEPCLPSNAPRPPAGEQWLHEVKQDGFRLMARRDCRRPPADPERPRLDEPVSADSGGEEPAFRNFPRL